MATEKRTKVSNDLGNLDFLDSPTKLGELPDPIQLAPTKPKDSPEVQSTASSKDKPSESKGREKKGKVEDSSDGVSIPKWSQDELLAVFDDILFQGEYEETYMLRSKLKIVFRTRTAEQTGIIARKIDSMELRLIPTMEQYRALLNLSYSLAEYNGKDLRKMEIQERFKFLSDMPSAVVGVLADKLAEFDLKVFMAFKEANENF